MAAYFAERRGNEDVYKRQVQNTRALQLIACITGNSDEPAGNRGSSKAQVDGCCGRANMLVTDHEPKDWGLDVGTMELGNTPRDL